ncbi:MAG TPA: MFS transporter [Caulobacteraceae bacterium]|nr:MFS transporter [Caulobacteraceae bacterium]
MPSPQKSEAAAALALAWAASIGALFLSLQPMIVGAWVDRAGLSLQEAGFAASANMLGKIVGTVCALALLRAGRTRRFIAAGALLAALGELATGMSGGSAMAITGSRLLAGFGGGVLMASAAASAATLSNPDRAFGLVLFSQTLTGALGLYAAPAILAAVGLTGMFLGLSALALTVLLVARFFAEPAPQGEKGSGPWRAMFGAATLLLIASLWIHYVANNGMWAHLERVGVGAGIAAGGIGTALAVGQSFGLVGSAAAMLLANRIPRVLAIAIGVVLTAGSALLLMRTTDALVLGAGVALFIGSLSFAVPFYLGALAARDASGRLIIVGQLAIMAGLFVGPSVAAWIVTSGSMNAMLWAAVVGFLLSLGLALAALRRATPQT